MAILSPINLKLGFPITLDSKQITVVPRYTVLLGGNEKCTVYRGARYIKARYIEELLYSPPSLVRAPLVRGPPSCAVFEPKILSPDPLQPQQFSISFMPFWVLLLPQIRYLTYKICSIWMQIKAVRLR